MTLDMLWQWIRICFLCLLLIILIGVLFCAIVILVEFMRSVIKQLRNKE